MTTMRASREDPIPDDPAASVDFDRDPHSFRFAAARTGVAEDGPIRVVGWHDDERGFSNRMPDAGRRLGVPPRRGRRPELPAS